MTNKKLEWRDLLPDLTSFSAVLSKPFPSVSTSFSMMQSRLVDGLRQLCNSCTTIRFMLLTAYEDEEYFKLISEEVRHILPVSNVPVGSRYVINGMKIQEYPAVQIDDNFAARDSCIWQPWIEHESLFGVLRCYQHTLDLQSGLVHWANGGVLIIGARTFINQPLLWFRLKQMILQKRFDWLSIFNHHPLPISIPSMPLDLKLIIIGDLEGISGLNILDPGLLRIALHSEFESELCINKPESIAQWCSWVNMLIQYKSLPEMSVDAWPILIRQSVRYSGDQYQLPLCPLWLTRRLEESALYSFPGELTANSLVNSDQIRVWRDSYLIQRMRDEVIDGQVIVDTAGKVVGQVNALSVVDFLGHPLRFGEVSRITCVVYFGEGEIKDVERKIELGGNIHAKGMMIMQAFLMSSLALNQQLPFSASLVFEQSYGEVEGDSASLAEGIVLVSALAGKPINQQIAVTGSIDQFGRVQPVGGVNEKIEGFFILCQKRKLTGTQGVIIPTGNARNLCLCDDIIAAVRDKQFFLWTVDTIGDALEIITELPFSGNEHPSLIASIRERIASCNLNEQKAFSWKHKWLNWFHFN